MKRISSFIIVCACLATAIAFNNCKDNNSDDYFDLWPLLSYTPVCAYSFGNNIDDDDNNYIGDYLLASQFTMSSNVVVHRLAVKLDVSSKYMAGIYTDQSNKPGTRIAQTGIQNGIAGWNMAFISSANLVSGNTYWLVAVSENAGIRDRDNTGSCKTVNKTMNWSSGELPSDLSSESWSGFTSADIKIYAISCN